MENQEDDEHRHNSFFCSRYFIGYIVIGGIAAYYLLTEHMAHVVGALPYLLLLACPLMHIFMHHGHGHTQGEHNRDASDSEPSSGERQ